MSKPTDPALPVVKFIAHDDETASYYLIEELLPTVADDHSHYVMHVVSSGSSRCYELNSFVRFTSAMDTFGFIAHPKGADFLLELRMQFGKATLVYEDASVKELIVREIEDFSFELTSTSITVAPLLVEFSAWERQLFKDGVEGYDLAIGERDHDKILFEQAIAVLTWMRDVHSAMTPEPTTIMPAVPRYLVTDLNKAVDQSDKFYHQMHEITSAEELRTLARPIYLAMKAILEYDTAKAG